MAKKREFDKMFVSIFTSRVVLFLISYTVGTFIQYIDHSVQVSHVRWRYIYVCVCVNVSDDFLLPQTGSRDKYLSINGITRDTWSPWVI